MAELCKFLPTSRVTIYQIRSTFFFEACAAEQAESATETKRELVKNLLAKLKESDCTLVMLYYFGEMTYAEIGEILGVSVNTVATRLHWLIWRNRGVNLTLNIELGMIR